MAGRPLDRRRRHQGRRDASRRALGRGRPREAPRRGGRGQLPGAGRERLALYQLHAPDPRVPLATSVRALADLKRQGLIDRVGLCNVTVSQIEEARRIVEIDSIQVEASLWHDQALPRRRGRLLRHPSPAAARLSAARRRQVTLADREEPGADGSCRAACRDAVRRRAGLARGPLRGHRPSSRGDANRERAIDRATPSAASDR